MFFTRARDLVQALQQAVAGLNWLYMPKLLLCGHASTFINAKRTIFFIRSRELVQALQ